MTSLWLALLLGALPSPVSHGAAALEGRHYMRADALAQSFLQHPPAHPGDDAVITAKLVTGFARLYGGNANDALTGLDLLQDDHIDLGPLGLALRAQALSRLDSCQAAFCAARRLPDDSLWALFAYQNVASCMLHHNPTLPVHHPMPQGVLMVHDALVRLAQASQSPQDAAHGWLLAGRLSSAWGDAQGADEAFSQVVSHYGSLTDGLRARSERLALRRSGRLPQKLLALRQKAAAEGAGSASFADPEALRRIFMSRTERLALLKDATRTRAAAPKNSPRYAAATLNLARLAQADSRYRTVQLLLKALLQKPRQPAHAAAAWLMLGDSASLLGRPTQALTAWQQSASVGGNTCWGTVALLHAAAAHLIHNQPQAAQLALVAAQKRLPLKEEFMLVRDDGAAVVMTQAMAQAEVSRLASLLQPEAHEIPALVAIAPKKSTDPAATATEQQANPIGRPHLNAPDLIAIELLIDHHLPATARSLMKLLPAQDLSDQERLVAAYLYARLGDTFRSTLLMQHCSERCRALDATSASLLYPQPFKKQVLTQSKRAHVPAALVYAIMREESGFNPGANSGRGAAGLMQLMPATARVLASQAHIAVSNRRALLHPDVSIALGAQLLHQLYRHFHGNIAAVAAAYQAGQPKAQSWLNDAERRGAYVPLAQVIPLASSRIYVEHVEASYQSYKAMLAGQSGADDENNASRVASNTTKLSAQ